MKFDDYIILVKLEGIGFEAEEIIIKICSYK